MDLTSDWLPVVHHGNELDEDQQSKGQEEHEAQWVDVNVLSRELQVGVDLRHLDEDDRVQELKRERCYEPEGVTDEVGEGDLCVRRGKKDLTYNLFAFFHHGISLKCNLTHLVSQTLEFFGHFFLLLFVMRQRFQVFGCQLSEELLLVLQGKTVTLLIKKKEIRLHL